jgi:hypothetical protein
MFGREETKFHIDLQWGLRFFVFGKGPETIPFIGLVALPQYQHELIAPNPETLSQERARTPNPLTAKGSFA